MAITTISTGQLIIITVVLKLKNISIHPWMAALNPSLVHFYFLREKYREIEEAEEGDSGYNFLTSTKANFWFFYFIPRPFKPCQAVHICVQRSETRTFTDRPDTQHTKDRGFAGRCFIRNRLRPWVLTSCGLIPSFLLGGTEAAPGLSVLPWQSWQVIWRSQTHWKPSLYKDQMF